MGYLSGSSPQLKSGIVSALSILVYQDVDTCLSMPDLVPLFLSLLHTKVAVVIKGSVDLIAPCLFLDFLKHNRINLIN